MTATRPDQPAPLFAASETKAEGVKAPPLPAAPIDHYPLSDPPFPPGPDWNKGGPARPWTEPQTHHQIKFCTSCQRRIFFAIVKRKKDGTLSNPQPFDELPSPLRKGYVMDDNGLMHHTGAARADERVYIGHFATCPQAQQHRKN